VPAAARGAELDADEDADVDGALAGLDELDELLHAPAVRTAPANAAAASHLLLIAYLPPEVAGPIPAPEKSTPSASGRGDSCLTGEQSSSWTERSLGGAWACGWPAAAC
jgi:hypothetical protein